MQLILEPADNNRLANVCGERDRNIRHIEQRFAVTIRRRGNKFEISGDPKAAESAGDTLESIFDQVSSSVSMPGLTPDQVHLIIQETRATQGEQSPQVVKTRKASIFARGTNQARYLTDIAQYDVCFGIGPAGTGKTFLAVACAVQALERGEVQRLILVRPAVEAGEKLGFLPGDLTQKVDPYLRPIYDALYDLLGFEKVVRHIEKGVIEIAPLAFMRGRTLNEAFIILDEAQNTTPMQMKMFLTRLGYGSTAVITGDLTQIDLAKGQQSGLSHCREVLKGTEGISFCFFNAADVIRHPLIERVLNAYERSERESS